MNYLLEAKHIGIEDDGYALVLAFADDEFEPQKYILLQKTLEPDEQDQKLGLDKTHLQIEDGARAGYGAVSSMRYLNNELSIALTAKGKECLGVDGEIVITLPNDSAAVKKLFEKLVVIATGEFIVERED